MKPQHLALAAGVAILAAGCATMGRQETAARAPEPAKAIDAASHYAGRWYEIARTPMKLTDGCVAGYTDYLVEDGGIVQRDGCRSGTPAGKEKSIAGKLRILDPGRNTKVHVAYRFFGVFPTPRTYWMLDHGDGWFVMSDPAFEHINVYTREPRPSQERLAMLNARVRSLGYDIAKLEYPATFPPGVS